MKITLPFWPAELLSTSGAACSCWRREAKILNPSGQAACALGSFSQDFGVFPVDDPAQRRVGLQGIFCCFIHHSLVKSGTLYWLLNSSRGNFLTLLRRESFYMLCWQVSMRENKTISLAFCKERVYWTDTLFTNCVIFLEVAVYSRNTHCFQK